MGGRSLFDRDEVTVDEVPVGCVGEITEERLVLLGHDEHLSH